MANWQVCFWTALLCEDCKHAWDCGVLAIHGFGVNWQVSPAGVGRSPSSWRRHFRCADRVASTQGGTSFAPRDVLCGGGSVGAADVPPVRVRHHVLVRGCAPGGSQHRGILCPSSLVERAGLLTSLFQVMFAGASISSGSSHGPRWPGSLSRRFLLPWI